MDLSKITPKISIELTEESIQELIEDALRNHMPGYEIKKITFSVVNSYDMRGEECGYKFGGAKIEFAKATNPKPSTQTTQTTQIPDPGLHGFYR